jgi:D-alanine-D-alanine ligase
MGKSQEITPARISEKQEKNVRQLAEFIYTTLGLKGYTRSEFIFIGDVPHLLEINTTPGLTEESLLPQQAKTAGISLESLFDSAIVEALR